MSRLAKARVGIACCGYVLWLRAGGQNVEGSGAVMVSSIRFKVSSS